MQTDQIITPSIHYAVLIIDESRLIIEYTDGSRAQILGEEALIRWQQIRRDKMMEDEPLNRRAAQR